MIYRLKLPQLTKISHKYGRQSAILNSTDLIFFQKVYLGVIYIHAEFEAHSLKHDENFPKKLHFVYGRTDERTDGLRTNIERISPLGLRPKWAKNEVSISGIAK